MIVNESLRFGFINDIYVAIGNRIGTKVTRDAFAQDVINSLYAGAPRASSLQKRKVTRKALLKSLQLIRQGFQGLGKQYTEAGRVSYRQIYEAEESVWFALMMTFSSLYLEKLTEKGFRKVYGEEALEVIESFFEHLIERIEKVPHSSERVRSTSGSFEIAYMIAKLWFKHFNKFPARDDKTNSPYKRVCIVVTDFLKVFGYPDYIFPTSKTAQVDAINTLKNCICESVTK